MMITIVWYMTKVRLVQRRHPSLLTMLIISNRKRQIKEIWQARCLSQEHSILCNYNGNKRASTSAKRVNLYSIQIRKRAKTGLGKCNQNSYVTQPDQLCKTLRIGWIRQTLLRPAARRKTQSKAQYIRSLDCLCQLLNC